MTTAIIACGTRVVIFIFHGSERYESPSNATRIRYWIFPKILFFCRPDVDGRFRMRIPGTFFPGAGSLRPCPPIVLPRVGVLSLSLLSLLLLLLLLLLMLYHYLWAAAATPVQAVYPVPTLQHTDTYRLNAADTYFVIT